MIRTTLLWVLVLCFVAPLAAEESNPDSRWTVFGFTHAYYEDGGDPDLTTFRLKLTRRGEWGGHLDFDIGNDTNQLQQFYVAHNGETGSWRIGRVFLGACYSTPAPFLNRMARYPRSAFTMAAYAYGLQWEKSFAGGKWNTTADLTGSSGLSFDEEGQFERVESSFRVTRTFSGSTYVAGAAQLSSDFARFAVDAGHRVGEVDLLIGLYYSDENHRERSLAGFARVEWEMSPWVRPHLQLDARPNGDDVWTPGIGFGATNLPLYAALDYEVGQEWEGVTARLQLSHSF